MRNLFSFVLAILLLSGVADAAYAQRDCPRSRLVPYQKGQVTPGDPNRMREEPSKSTNSFETIPGGGIFTVYETGRCAEGYLWARVLYNNKIGWTAEAQGSDYFVEPVAPPDGAIVIPAGILDVAWSSDGETIAIATTEGVYTLKTALPTPIPQLLSQGWADDVEFSPTAPDMLATSAAYGMVRVWDLRAKQVLYEIIGGDPYAVALDGNAVGSLGFSSDGNLLFMVSSFNLEVYDTTTWTPVHVLEDYMVDPAVMSPDGQQIAINPWYPDKPYVTDWSGERRPLGTGDLSDFIRSLKFSPDGKIVSMSDNQGHVLNQILATGDQHTFTATFDDDYHFIDALSFSPDSTLLAIGDYTAQGGVLRLMDAATMQPIGTVTPERVDQAGPSAFSPDGSQIASAFDNVLLILNTADIH